MTRTHRKWLGGAVVLIVLLAVFGMYAQPDFMLSLADQLWSCF